MPRKAEQTGSVLLMDEAKAPAIPAYEEAPDPEEIALANVLEQLGDQSGVTIKVYRYRKDGSGGYIGTMDPEEFSVENMAERFGGGEFRVRVFDSGNRIQFNRRICIEAPFKDFSRDPSQNLAPAPAESGIEKLAAVMTHGFMELGKLVVNQGNSRPQTDPLEQLEKLSGVMRNLMPQTAPAQSGPSMSELFGIFKTGLEMGKEAGGGGSSEFDVMKVALENLGPVFAAAMQNQQQAPAEQISAPALPNPAPESKPKPEGENVNFAARFLVTTLLNAARRKADPTLYADFILDNASAEQINSILAPADWWEKITAHVPAAAPYRAWCEEVRKLVLDPEALADGLTANEKPVNNAPKKQPKKGPAPGAAGTT